MTVAKKAEDGIYDKLSEILKNVKAKDKVQYSYRTNGIQTGRLKF